MCVCGGGGGVKYKSMSLANYLIDRFLRNANANNL